jgi:carbon monoxide dehydrogenase subunit G
MDLKHEFTVEKPIDEAWNILTNVELIAPCLPGAQLEEVEGDTYRGMVKVKVGPISAAFKGQASFVERDDANYRAVLKGEGRDTGGKGNASANITAAMTAVSPTSTKVDVTTDLTITGKVAQFGRGAMADISDKLLGQFVENLNELIAQQPEIAAESPAASTEGVRKIDGPEAQPLNLVGAAGLPILKRAIPVVVIVAVVIWLIAR